MNQLLKKNKYLLIMGSVVLTLIIFITLVVSYLNNKTTNYNTGSINIPVKDSTPLPIKVSTPIIDKINYEDWKTFSYDQNYISPSFQLEYPSDWEESFCESSGCWNINLKKDGKDILIDLSAQGGNTFEESLQDWVTGFGSNNINYSFEIIKQSTLSGNRNYIIYKVTEDGKTPYLISIVDVAAMYNGRGHLAIKATDEQNIELVNEILNSIQ